MDEIERIRKQFDGLEIGIKDKNGIPIKVGDKLKSDQHEGMVVYVAEHASFLILDMDGYHRIEQGDLRLQYTEVI